MRYALLFRGLNVGGRAAVKMADLAACLREAGFGGVRTYIQSGNAVLEADCDEAALLARVREAYERHFGMPCELTARTAAQLRAAVAGLPFTAEEIAAAEALNPHTEHLYGYFLPAPPAPETLDVLAQWDWGGDRLHAAGRDLYLLLADGVRTSRLVQRLARLLPAATARNWNTVRKLLALLDGAGD